MDLPRLFEIKHVDTSTYYIVDLDRGAVLWSDNNGHSSSSGETEWAGYTEQRVAKYIEIGVWKITEVLDGKTCVEVTDLL